MDDVTGSKPGKPLFCKSVRLAVNVTPVLNWRNKRNNQVFGTPLTFFVEP